ncbi:MAG: DUF6114 domain-containing protein [Haloarculaceae archaeon]
MTDDVTTGEFDTPDVVTSADDDPAGTETISFAEWRASRPFGGAIGLILGGLVIAWPAIEFLLRTTTLASGSVISLGIVLGGLLVLLGAAALVRPEHATALGAAGLVLSSISFVVVFGGFLVGMVLSGAGGLLCFAWRPDDGADYPLGED